MIAILRDTFLWAKTSCVVYTELHNTCQIKSILSTEWKISKLKMCVLPHAHGTELDSNFFLLLHWHNKQEHRSKDDRHKCQ